MLFVLPLCQINAGHFINELVSCAFFPLSSGLREEIIIIIIISDKDSIVFVYTCS